jgi:hypothetical protein
MSTPPIGDFLTLLAAVGAIFFAVAFWCSEMSSAAPWAIAVSFVLMMVFGVEKWNG